jgi:hypothetical protein
MSDQKQLLIPEKIKVGFQNREGTYTGKLAYVIYYDLKGKLRKETSWESWRDDKIAPVEFENTPTSGFVLNKGVGGARQSYGWNARNEYIRVYDPRDFEFEISVANLLFILRETDCSRGKGLEGEFVYAWDGSELVLLPTGSQDYKNSKQFTKLQTCSVKSKDLIPGASYITKKQQNLVFLGRFDFHFVVDTANTKKGSQIGVKKQYVFWDANPPKRSSWWRDPDYGNFVFLDDLKTIASVVTETPIANYAELVEQYNKSPWASKVVKLYTKPVPSPEKADHYSNRFHQQLIDGTFVEYYLEDRSWYRSHPENKVVCSCQYFFRNGILVGQACHHRSDDRIKPDDQRLFAVLENGLEFRLIGYNLSKGNSNG